MPKKGGSRTSDPARYWKVFGELYSWYGAKRRLPQLYCWSQRAPWRSRSASFALGYSDIPEGVDKAPTGDTSLTIDLQEKWVRSPLLLGQISISGSHGDDVIFMRAEGPKDKPWEKQTAGSINRVTGVLSFAKLYNTADGKMGWTQRYELRCRPAQPIF